MTQQSRTDFVLEYRDTEMVSSVHGLYSTLDFAIAVALELAEEAVHDAYPGDDVRIDRQDGNESVVICLLDGGGGEMCERWTIRPMVVNADAPARPPQDQYLAELRAGLDEASGVVPRDAEPGAEPETWR